MRSCICKIEDIVYELDKIKWENNYKSPTVISIIPYKFERESYKFGEEPHKNNYITKEVKIIYRID